MPSVIVCRVSWSIHSANFMFAECVISGTRQIASLSSVSSKTLGILLHSAYLLFTECQHSASRGHSAITTTWPARAPFYRAACRPLVLRRVSVRDTRRSIDLPSVLFRHSAKCMGLPSVYGDTRRMKNNFSLLGPPQFFYSPHTTFCTAC